MNESTTSAARPGTRVWSPAAMIGAAVMIASLGAAAGWMMHSSRNTAPEAPAKLALAPNETLVPPASMSAAPTTPATTPAPVQAAPEQQVPQAVQPAPAPTRHATTRHEPTHHASTAPAHNDTTVANSSAGTAAGSGTNNATPLETKRVAVCDNCGVVEGVRAVQHKGEGSGLGAVAGGVLGGVLGHQVGGGKGKSAMTVLGAVGGGLAGHEIEKRAKSETVYEVRVRMDDGSVRTLTQRTSPTPGARVVVEGNSMRAASQRDNGQGV